MQRQILHVDQNFFYANCELAEHPELRGKPVVVGGEPKLRHGIVLAKSPEAKACGIKTAETLWQARQKCPDLIIRSPNYPLYMHYSALARRIYYDYTDLVEPFGPDEAWLDVSGSAGLNGGVSFIAQEISERVKAELGLSVSIGVSWNKIFAKFGSDYQKPDAITYINRDNYRQIVWRSPVRDLLYVGAATERKLAVLGIQTIGELALVDTRILDARFGKIGAVLQSFARGEDASPVKAYDLTRENVDRSIKSYGNGLTAPHDICEAHDAKALIYLLAESVAQRMREGLARAQTVAIGVRRADLSGYTRQSGLPVASNSTSVIARAAWTLLRQNEKLDAEHPLRALSVTATDLVPTSSPVQLSILPDASSAEIENLDAAIDELRRRFGNTCVRRGVELQDASLVGLDVKRDNIVHPVGFFHT